jgi:hypothetical protein
MFCERRAEECQPPTLWPTEVAEKPSAPVRHPMVHLRQAHDIHGEQAMNAKLLAIAVTRSGRIDLIENVASTRAEAT